MTWAPRSYQRRIVLTRDGAQCRYCARRVYPQHMLTPEQWLDIGLTFDHFIPRHDRGPSEVWNLFISCYRCNADKGHDAPGGDGKWQLLPAPLNPIALVPYGQPEEPMRDACGIYFPDTGS